MKKNLMILSHALSDIRQLRRINHRYDISLVEGSLNALLLLKKIPVDVILMREGTPEMDAIEFLMNVHDLHPKILTVVLCRESGSASATLPEMPSAFFVKEPIDENALDRFFEMYAQRIQSQPRALF